jgi:DNA polymerase-3 subunit alpha
VATAEDYLRDLTFKGAAQRWGEALPPEVTDRLGYELQVIAAMGFSSYFLIVWDLIKHAKDNGIRVGPGRGSAAGCAVAYCLAITDMDPIRYDLLFERFLNPSRISMPDIDMDFDSRYRDEMIRYAAERYGRDHVAQIVTFSTIKARAAVRDAARVLDRVFADPPSRHTPGPEGRGQPAFDVRPTRRQAGGRRRPRPEGCRDGSAAAVVITRAADHLPPIGASPSGQALTTPSRHPGEMRVEDLPAQMDFLGLRNLDVITDDLAGPSDPGSRPTSTPALDDAGVYGCSAGATRWACSS